ncbi:hypothetical protein D3C76_1401490 [compost metagenome]
MGGIHPDRCDGPVFLEQSRGHPQNHLDPDDRRQAAGRYRLYLLRHYSRLYLWHPVRGPAGFVLLVVPDLRRSQRAVSDYPERHAQAGLGSRSGYSSRHRLLLQGGSGLLHDGGGLRPLRLQRGEKR